MNTYQDLENSLFEIVTSQFPDWEVIMAFDNGPEPTGPYIVVDVQRLSPIGREYNSTPTFGIDGQQLTVTTIQDHEAKVRFEFIGKYDDNTTLAEMVSNLQVALRTERGYQLQQEHRLSLFGMTNVRRIPIKRETSNFMIYQLDCNFGYAIVMTTDVDTAAGVIIDGVYHDAGREPDHVIHSHIEINTNP